MFCTWNNGDQQSFIIYLTLLKELASTVKAFLLVILQSSSTTIKHNTCENLIFQSKLFSLYFENSQESGYKCTEWVPPVLKHLVLISLITTPETDGLSLRSLWWTSSLPSVDINLCQLIRNVYGWSQSPWCAKMNNVPIREIQSVGTVAGGCVAIVGLVFPVRRELFGNLISEHTLVFQIKISFIRVNLPKTSSIVSIKNDVFNLSLEG